MVDAGHSRVRPSVIGSRRSASSVNQRRPRVRRREIESTFTRDNCEGLIAFHVFPSFEPLLRCQVTDCTNVSLTIILRLRGGPQCAHHFPHFRCCAGPPGRPRVPSRETRGREDEAPLNSDEKKGVFVMRKHPVWREPSKNKSAGRLKKKKKNKSWSWNFQLWLKKRKHVLHFMRHHLASIPLPAEAAAQVQVSPLLSL